MSVERSNAEFDLDEPAVDADFEDFDFLHFRANLKHFSGDTANRQATWGDYFSFSLEDQLDPGYVALVTGLQVYDHSLNISDIGSLNTSAQLNVINEISTNDEAQIAIRDYDLNNVDRNSTFSDSGTTFTTGLDAATDDDGYVFWADRIDALLGWNDSTNGAAAGSSVQSNPGVEYVDLLERFGGPLMMMSDDELHFHQGINEGDLGGTNDVSYSTRMIGSLCYLPYQVSEQAIPEVAVRLGRGD